MVNIDELINRTTEFKINGKTIHVKEITLADFEEMIEIEETQGIEGHLAQANFIARVLSDNKEGIDFTIEDIKNLQKAAISKIWQTLVARSLDTVSDPN